MSYSTAQLASLLRAAREAQGMSQRDLSRLVDVPQGHISKIESGGVDLRVSSLIELARALDLEVALVPRKSVPAVQSVVRSTSESGPATSHVGGRTPKEFARLDRPLAELTRSFPASIELAQLVRQLRDLRHLPLSKEDRDKLSDVHAVLLQVLRTKNLEPIAAALAALQDLRSNIVQGTLGAPVADSVRPAYSLDEDEND